MKIRFCIDRGGTFTDCVAEVVEGATVEDRGRIHVHKLLSEDPANYDDAPREGIRRLLEKITGRVHPKEEPVDTSQIESIRMATTVATNALLERKGERFALLITRGFKDLLQIGNQARPDIFDLAISTPEVLYDAVMEVDERVTLGGYSAGGPGTMKVPAEEASTVQYGITGEALRVIQPLQEEQVRLQLQQLVHSGITSIAVALVHAYTFPQHEQTVGRIAKEMGIRHITLSSSIMPMIKIVPRGMSACVDAYLTPCIHRYLSSFSSGFDDKFRDIPVLFMQSDGGLTPMDRFTGIRAILSGPAGGVVGYAKTTFQQTPVIGFDMGGTSTDVSRYAGHYEHVFETSTAGVIIQAPQLDIHTVAAGGGSRLFFRNGMFVVGPESAGAHPGPACYRKGGPLTITDANLVLGRLLPEFFPRIFGPKENEPLDVENTLTKFQQLAMIINESSGGNRDTNLLSLDEVAYGFIKVANETMCRPIRALTQAKGFDTKKHILSCFGGAGGQHACAIARTLGISKIYIHQYSSVLSAYGLGLANVVQEVQEPCAVPYSAYTKREIKNHLASLSEKCCASLEQQGYAQDRIHVEQYLNLRYQGTDTAIMTLVQSDADILAVFTENYRREFGFVLHGRDVIVDDLRVRAQGKSSLIEEMVEVDDRDHIPIVPLKSRQQCATVNVYFEIMGRQPTPVFRLEDLAPGNAMIGPCIVLDENSTIVVEPNCQAFITRSGNVVIELCGGETTSTSTLLDPIQLSIFSHRFMSIAEQMGRALQRTSISTNIKERLDFSCAIFGPDGGLVANAPHIPVHLGSMQEAVKYQLVHHGKDLRPGDVLISNHPMAGGSHLPDITAITPVFSDNKVVFFVASRGHHADIGGISPGSMPPSSKYLFQEGAAMKSFKLVRAGEFQEEGLTKILLHDPAQYPDCTGTRNLRDNISDLKAQVAANHRGIVLVQELMQEYGTDVVLAYMHYIRENAEIAVRSLLKEVVKKGSKRELSAQEFMDDGSPIQLHVSIDEKQGSAVFDFEGTGLQVYGNTNAPPSVTFSAVIYCLRCMVGTDIPLNQGCLTPIEIRLPENSMLRPSEEAAVVGGNVLTSQRLVDVILKAFGACAASQGCMNNLTFGMAPDPLREREGWGYYETIAGGSGAGPTWQGRDGVHTHMTNTRITDPEILERRYPILLRRFEIRSNSGGNGRFRGGHGLIRELEFYEPIKVSILSERRVFRPYGLEGGEDGQVGLNIWHRNKDGVAVNLGGKSTFVMEKGDRLCIMTPGGGGYGRKDGAK